MKLDSTILDVLRRARINGNQLTLPEQLDRKEYVRVDKVLTALGGDWNRKAKAHVFDEEDPMLLIELVLASGELDPPETFGHFPTPEKLARELVERADVQKWHDALEPSAGTGRIARALNERAARVDCVELQEKNVKVLRGLGLSGDIHHEDFLTMQPVGAFGGPIGKRWPRVVMNPPFSGFGKTQLDIIHVTHALKFLAPGGVLVAVMSAGVEFATRGLAPEFRKLVAKYGDIERLPEKTFHESGTDVNTVVVTIQPREH